MYSTLKMSFSNKILERVALDNLVEAYLILVHDIRKMYCSQNCVKSLCIYVYIIIPTN